MSTTERQKQILEILKQRNYVSVQELSQRTFTSASSIRRDLTYLQNNGLVKRSHGGVTLSAPVSGVDSFLIRKTKNIPQKRIIAKKAASLLRSGQKILLDGSSTAGFLLPHIARHTDVTVFTNNIFTAMRAIEMGIQTHCIGGHSVNGSVVLSGTEAYRYVSALHADILFFSSQCLSKEGIISDSTEEENYLRSLMISAAEKTVFLCDSEKFNSRALFTLTTIDQIDVAVFDADYPGLERDYNIL